MARKRLERGPKVEIKIDPEHLIDVVTVSEFVAIADVLGAIALITEGSDDNAIPAILGIAPHAVTIRGMLCKMVWSDGAYLPEDEARPLVDQFTLRQLRDSLIGIMDILGGTDESNDPTPRESQTGEQSDQPEADRSTSG